MGVGPLVGTASRSQSTGPARDRQRAQGDQTEDQESERVAAEWLRGKLRSRNINAKPSALSGEGTVLPTQRVMTRVFEGISALGFSLYRCASDRCDMELWTPSSGNGL